MNDQVSSISNIVTTNVVSDILKAIVAAVVTSDAFTAAVKATVEAMDQKANEFDFKSDEFKEAVNAIINEDDALIMFDNTKFKEAVDERIGEYDFEDTVKGIVADMSFSVSADRY